jgi:hypothetical protein
MANNKHSENGGEQLGVRQFAAKLCVSITLLVGLLAAGECAAFLFLSWRTGPDAFRNEYKSYVIWRGRPSQHQTMVTVDEGGLRRTMNSQCEANDYTIWMFGGSGLWGSFNRDRETIPSLLAKRYEDSGRPVCVRNYGQKGWTSTQEVIELQLELKRISTKPDVVIFYDGSADSLIPYETDEFDVHMGFPAAKREFESWTGEGFAYFGDTNTHQALQWLAGRLHLDVHNSISASQVIAKAKRTLANYLGNMEIVDALAMYYRFHYVWFSEPWLQASQKPLSAEEVLIRDRDEVNYPGGSGVMKTTYDLFRTVNRPHFVYLGDIFKDHPETLFLDSSHLGTEGNRLVADRIFEVLQHLGS